MTEIRAERQGDKAAIAAVVQAAFGGDLEARLIERLRAEKELALSLVAMEGGEVVGHVAFAWAGLRGEGRAIAWLAPLAVAPQRQGRGIGSALVRQGLDECRARDFDHAVVVGDEGYYARFGFAREMARGLQSRWSEGLMALALAGDAKVPAGELIEPRAFSVLD